MRVERPGEGDVGGVAPELLEALLDANRGTAAPYGDDDCTRAMTARFRHAFEHDGLLAFPLALLGVGLRVSIYPWAAHPTGWLAPGVFVARNVMAKCPSKFQAQTAPADEASIDL